VSESESFPVIDGHVNVGDAAEAIARRKARGAVVRNGAAFALVGWSDVARALEHSQGEPVRVIRSVPIHNPEIRMEEVVHIDIDRMRDAHPGVFQEAQLFTCACGYRGERPRTGCPKGDDCQQAAV
jgi:hypothetical protein